MSINFTEDLDFMLADAGGALATCGGVNAFGILQVADEALLAEETGVYGAKWTLTVRTGALPGLAQDAALTVGGTAYQVRGHMRTRDGGLTVVLLADGA